MSLDFSKLGPIDLTEFLQMHQRPVPGPHDQLVAAAAELFQQLQDDPEAVFALPVVDLFLVTQFLEGGGSVTEQYTESDLIKLTPEQRAEFGAILGLAPDDPQFTTRLTRIIRILGALKPESLNLSAWSCPIASADGDTTPLDWIAFEPPAPLEEDSEYEQITCIGDGNCFFHAFLRGVDQLYIQSYSIETITEQELREYERAAAPFKFKFARTTLSPSRGPVTMSNPETIYQINNDRLFGMNMGKFRTAYACAFRKRLAQHINSNQQVHQLILKLFPEAYTIFHDEALFDHPEMSPGQIDAYALTQLINYYAGRIGQNRSSIEPDILILISELYDYDIYILSDTKVHDPDTEHPFPDRDLISVIRGPQDMRVPLPTMTDEEADRFMDRPNRSAIILLYTGGVEGHYDLIVRVDYLDEGKEIVSKFGPDEPFIRQLYEYVLIFRHIE